MRYYIAILQRDTTHETKEIYAEFVTGLGSVITKAEGQSMPPHSRIFWSNFKGLRMTGGWRQRLL